MKTELQTRIPAEIIFFDTFIDNRNGWEIVDSKSETAIIEKEGYHLENHVTENWHHFSTFLSLTTTKGLDLQCIMKINEKTGQGQFGLLWGFDEKMSRLNRFCISTSGKGCSVLHFEKNHRPVFYRFFDPFAFAEKSQEILLQIREHRGYFYFRINKKLIYISHCSHFANMGNGFGFYVDPGVSIIVKKLRIKKLSGI